MTRVSHSLGSGCWMDIRVSYSVYIGVKTRSMGKAAGGYWDWVFLGFYSLGTGLPIISIMCV